MQGLFYKKVLQDPIMQKVMALSQQEDIRLREEVMGEIIETAYHLELGGNLFKKLLCYKIVTDENAFTLSAEREGKAIDATYKELVLEDIAKLKALFHSDGIEIQLREKETVFQKVYDAFEEKRSDEEILKTLIEFYHQSGAGMMNGYNAFKWHTNQKLIGIKNCDTIQLEDLVGCDYQKEMLIRNTENFLQGKMANHVLLFGDAGTGKSSSVKALLNEYKHQGLRLIELSKSDFRDFNAILKCIKDRGLKYILFLDDLSFEEFETEYKYMKALIEGGVEVTPKNVLIYATSNRRHLIRETWEERQGEEVHVSDTRQEKLSLSDRFGLTLTFTSPNQKVYLEMVYKLAHQYNIDIPENSLREKAIQWELLHSGRSGRVAKQFIQSLM
ncbi:MAG: ATP-binding protein [Cellulosilyticum sp.]|nr:ATP-binding protein [Cellulosilyticum sp.]